MRLECRSVNVHLTAIIDDLQPTCAFSRLYALEFGAVQGAAHRTQADEGAQAVHTVSIYTRTGLTLIHIFAYVGLGVKAISFGALTGEAARGVPAQAVLTEAPVHEALVNVNAVFACQVDLEAFIASAFVRPQHVLTHSILADVRVQGTFIYISPISSDATTVWTQSQELRGALWRTGLAGLPVGILRVGTAAFRLGHRPEQRPDALSAPVPAVTRAAHVCVDTDTSVQAHCHPRHALTPEGALGVHTVSVHAHPRSLTLINVYTHAPSGVQQIPRFTDALEAPIFIYAQPVQAHVSDQTLVLVLTVLAVCRDLKASVADTVEAPLSVHTAPVVTDSTVGHTLVQISALGPGGRGLKASGTLTDVGAGRVHTFSVHTGVSLALIVIDALSSTVQPEAHVTLTPVAEGAGHWDAPAVQTQVPVGLAHVGDVLSLDDHRSWLWLQR